MDEGKREQMGKGRSGLNVVNRTFSLNQGDIVLLEWGADHLGCSRSEFARSAIRAFASQLQMIETQRAMRKL